MGNNRNSSKLQGMCDPQSCSVSSHCDQWATWLYLRLWPIHWQNDGVYARIRGSSVCFAIGIHNFYWYILIGLSLDLLPVEGDKFLLQHVSSPSYIHSYLCLYTYHNYIPLNQHDLFLCLKSHCERELGTRCSLPLPAIYLPAFHDIIYKANAFPCSISSSWKLT